MKILLNLLEFLLIIPLISSDLFSAIADLEKLVNTGKQIHLILEKYLSNEEQKLSQLRQLSKHYLNLESINNKDDVDSYLANPINAFVLVKRLTNDWKRIEKVIQNSNKENIQNILYILKQNNTFPTAKDLTGATEALFRLQDMYRLDTNSLANGLIPIRDIYDRRIVRAPKKRTALTFDDCFEIGSQAYEAQDHYHTFLWMQEALNRFDREVSVSDRYTEKEIILEYLSFAVHKLGNVSRALQLTQQLVALAPEHPRAKGNLQYYQKEWEKIQSNSSKKTENVEESGRIKPPKLVPPYAMSDSMYETYHALCRGEKRMSMLYESQLVCFHLNTTRIPVLRLSRIKVEEAFKRPQIVVFHDIISDTEIKVIKSLAKPMLRRALVVNHETGLGEPAKYRISKSAWLGDHRHAVVQRVSRRISAVTGLDMSSAEELQIVNYGIGGQYEPHYDHSHNTDVTDSINTEKGGNRIATWMNYMSDVEAGGATVFPLAGVTIWPRKGSAAFWYNLLKWGGGDALTNHAGCPVLIGSKWVSNKWIHQKGQEFRKLCSPDWSEHNIVEQT